MALEVRSAVAAASTNRQARALLGVAADFLRRAYELVPQLSGLGEVRESARELLDRTNLYAQEIYGMLPDNDAALDESVRPRLLVALQSAQSDLQLVAQVNKDLEVDYLQALLSAVAVGLAALAKAAAGAATENWGTTAVIVVLLVIGWHALRPVLVGARA